MSCSYDTNFGLDCLECYKIRLPFLEKFKKLDYETDKVDAEMEEAMKKFKEERK